MRFRVTRSSAAGHHWVATQPPCAGAYLMDAEESYRGVVPAAWYIDLYDLEDIQRVIRLEGLKVIIDRVGRTPTLEIYDADRE